MSTDPPVNTGALPDSTATITATDAVGARCSRRKGRVVIDRDVLPRAPRAGQTNREARPANLRKADLRLQREAGCLRNRSESTTEGLDRAGRLRSGTGWWLLHVQRNARMHLRFAGGFDTMA